MKMHLDFVPPNDSKVHSYCLFCQSETVRKVFIRGRINYRCTTCQKTSDREILIDPEIVWWIDDEKNYWHESVGAFIINPEDKILLFDRTLFPFAHTIPAGHLDRNENPSVAIAREVREETELKILSFKEFIIEKIHGDSCRRGCDDHLWHLFTAHLTDIPEIKISEEGGSPIWVTIDEALTLKLTLPVRYFLNKFGIRLLIP